MRNMIIVSSLMLLLAVGCTAPTQKIATVAMQRGMDHTYTIVDDLANIAKQSALDIGAIEVREAVRSSSEPEAVNAVKKSFNQCNKINWLQIQNEKARAELRLAQMYIWSQEGILDIMYDEFKSAKEESDAKDMKTEEISNADIEKLAKTK